MYLRYTYPAAGKYETAKAYSLESLKEEIAIELIKSWFTPIDFKWSDLEPKIEVETEVKVSKSKSKVIAETAE